MIPHCLLSPLECALPFFHHKYILIVPLNQLIHSLFSKIYVPIDFPTIQSTIDLLAMQQLQLIQVCLFFQVTVIYSLLLRACRQCTDWCRWDVTKNSFLCSVKLLIQLVTCIFFYTELIQFFLINNFIRLKDRYNNNVTLGAYPCFETCSAALDVSFGFFVINLFCDFQECSYFFSLMGGNETYLNCSALDSSGIIPLFYFIIYYIRFVYYLLQVIHNGQKDQHIKWSWVMEWKLITLVPPQFLLESRRANFRFRHSKVVHQF